MLALLIFNRIFLDFTIFYWFSHGFRVVFGFCQGFGRQDPSCDADAPGGELKLEEDAGVYGWFMGDLWVIYGWLVGDLWMIYGWLMVIDGWYVRRATAARMPSQWTSLEVWDDDLTRDFELLHIEHENNGTRAWVSLAANSIEHLEDLIHSWTAFALCDAWQTWRKLLLVKHIQGESSNISCCLKESSL